MLQDLPKCDTRNEVSKCCWEDGAHGLVQHRVATHFQFVKGAVLIKYNIKMYVYIVIFNSVEISLVYDFQLKQFCIIIRLLILNILILLAFWTPL